MSAYVPSRVMTLSAAEAAELVKPLIAAGFSQAQFYTWLTSQWLGERSLTALRQAFNRG